MDALRLSLVASNLFLGGTSFITFVESLRTTSTATRHVMNLETAVSLVASIAYGYLTKMNEQKPDDYDSLTFVRYADWVVTTPLLLLAMSLFLAGDELGDGGLRGLSVSLVVALDLLMLALGFLGEVRRKDRARLGAASFVVFGVLFTYLYVVLARHSERAGVFYFVTAVWGLYGVLYYWKDPVAKNIAYNALDVVSKVCVGLYFWLVAAGLRLFV